MRVCLDEAVQSAEVWPGAEAQKRTFGWTDRGDAAPHIHPPVPLAPVQLQLKMSCSCSESSYRCPLPLPTRRPSGPPWPPSLHLRAVKRRHLTWGRARLMPCTPGSLANSFLQRECLGVAVEFVRFGHLGEVALSSACSAPQATVRQSQTVLQ